MNILMTQGFGLSNEMLSKVLGEKVTSLSVWFGNLEKTLQIVDKGVFDFIFFGGGSDVLPNLYGETNDRNFSYTSPQRDLLEITLFRRALPVAKTKFVGICRGSQFLNVMFQGTLHQDLGWEQKAHPHIHKVMLADKENNPLKEFITDVTFTVNSTHHQAVKRLGSGLYPLLYEPGTGVIEGFYNNRVRAVQSHPESLLPEYNYSETILKYLFFKI